MPLLLFWDWWHSRKRKQAAKSDHLEHKYRLVDLSEAKANETEERLRLLRYQRGLITREH